MKKYAREALCLLLLVMVGALAYHHFRGTQGSEPDVSFHLALARDTVARGLLRSLPQAENIEWGKHFTEKQFLFTQLTALFYRWGGDEGVLRFTFVLICAVLFALYLHLRGTVSPAFAALLVIAYFLVYEALAYRISELRPHVLALVCFLIGFWGLGKGRWAICAFAGLFFSLSYHATYMVLLLAGIGLAASQGENQIAIRKAALGLLIGVLVGLLANPYFPDNIQMLVTGVRIALNGSNMPAQERVLEGLPIGLVNFARYHAPIWIILLVVTLEWIFVRHRQIERLAEWSRESATVRLRMGLILAWCLAALSWASPRALDYLGVLCFVVGAPWLVRQVQGSVWKKRALVGVCVCAIAVQVRAFATPTEVTADSVAIVEAIRRIPADAAGKKVFNCEWPSGSFIYYHRPDLRFTDLSDPILLLDAEPFLFSLKRKLSTRAVAAPYGVIKFAFGADYVLCNRLEVVEQLDRDPHFVRMYPRSEDVRLKGHQPYYFLFEVSPAPLPQLVQSFQMSPAIAGELSVANAEWKTLSGTSELAENQRSPYLNLLRYKREAMEQARAERKELCVQLRPTETEQRRHLGASYLGVGGGDRLRIWLNGSSVYDAATDKIVPSLVHQLIQFPTPLTSRDRLEVQVCSGRTRGHMGLALSLWTESEIRARCPMGDPCFASYSLSKERLKGMKISLNK